MQVTSKKTNPYNVEITIKESAKEMQKYERQAAADIASQRQFKGFKKGSTDVPVELVAAEVGPGFLESETLQKALEHLYPKALRKADVSPVDQGEIKDITSIMPLEVTLLVEVLPEIELDIKKASKIQVEKESVSVTADDVKKDMEEIEAKNITYEEAKKGATIKKDDRIMIHAHGYDKKGGTRDDRLHLHDFSFVIGAGTMIPGFEDHFIGKKVGDAVAFDITFPKDYHSEDFAGKTKFFDCEVEAIEHATKPEWTPEFIEQVWGKKIELDVFKKELKDAITQERESAVQQTTEDKIYDKLIELATIEVGPRLLARETQQVWQQHAQDISRRGMEPKMYLDHIGMSEDDFKKLHLEPLALRRLQAQLILEHLRNNMPDMTVSDAEVKDETKEMFKAYGDNADFLKRVEEMYAPGNDQFEELRARLQYRKIIESFITGAKSAPQKADTKTEKSTETKKKAPAKKKSK